MEQLVSFAMGIAFSGPAYPRVEGILLNRCRRVYAGKLDPCDVHAGYRTHGRKAMCRQWDQGPDGFVRRADPCRSGPFTFYGWQAKAVAGGACGGLMYPDGLAGHFYFKVRLCRIRSLQEDVPFCFHYKAGISAACGATGTRLVPPKLWLPVPNECLHVQRSLSRSERHWNVECHWLKEAAWKLGVLGLGFGALWGEALETVVFGL
ncbi:MAG: hypothetical protein IPN44_07500 [Flavobacteriales bacterium]|nr:hypothetical protein [Flavobacteriales bacterium]